MTPGFVLIAVIVIACAAAGSAIGARKGHPVWGLFMGLLLSVLGVAIVALSKGREAPKRGGSGGGMLAAFQEARR
jgi:hypothetical protein